MREGCQISFFSCREEGKILKDTEDQGSADNQEIRENKIKPNQGDAVSAYGLPVDQKDYL